MWPLALAAALVLGAGITVVVIALGGGDDQQAPADDRDTTAALPLCSQAFRPGQKIDQRQAAGGCLDPAGTVQAIGSTQCQDGRHLYQVDASTGARPGWGYGGDVYHAVKGDVAANAGYKKAYDTCMSS